VYNIKYTCDVFDLNCYNYGDRFSYGLHVVDRQNFSRFRFRIKVRMHMSNRLLVTCGRICIICLIGSRIDWGGGSLKVGEGMFLTTYATISFSRKNLLHSISWTLRCEQ
jgi:hypothetical protein